MSGNQQSSDPPSGPADFPAIGQYELVPGPGEEGYVDPDETVELTDVEQDLSEQGPDPDTEGVYDLDEVLDEIDADDVEDPDKDEPADDETIEEEQDPE